MKKIRITAMVIAIILTMQTLVLEGAELLNNIGEGILEETENFEESANEEIKEETISGESIDTEEILEEELKEDNEFYDEVKEIIEKDNKYTKLSFKDKNILNKRIGVREDTMTKCQENGYSLKESITKALIMQRLDISLEETLKMEENFESGERAAKEALKFREHEYRCEFLIDEDIRYELLKYLIDGKDTDTIMEKYVISLIKGISLKKAFEYEEEKDIYENDIYIKKEELGIEKPDIMTLAEESENWELKEAYEPEMTGMFNVKEDVYEKVNYSKGALVLEDTAVYIPGRGLDLKLKYTYDSSRDYDKDGSKGDTYIGCFRLEEARLIMGNGYPLKYKSKEGSEYKLKANNTRTEFLVRYYPYLGARPKIEADKESTVLKSKYKAEYKSGKIEYFDSTGYLVGIKDRFGNTITITRNINNISKIKDTIGREIIISKSGNGYITKFTLPDKSEVTYEDKTEGTLKSVIKTDEKGDKTTYTYKNTLYKTTSGKVRDINQKTITKIEYPTGMTSEYTYDKGTISEENREYYYRLKTKKNKIEGKYCNDRTFEYSDINYYGKDKENYYEYWVKETDSKGNNTIYKYDERNLIKSEEKTGDVKVKKEYEYEYYDKGNSKNDGEIKKYKEKAMNMDPVKIITNTDGLVVTEIKKYDINGFVKDYWRPEKNGSGNVTEYYNNETGEECYHVNTMYTNEGIVSSRTYNKDAYTEVKEENNVDNGLLKASMIYDVKNGVKTLKSKKEYKYDIYGNMTEEKEYITSNKPIITYLSYDANNLNLTEIKKDETAIKYTYNVMGRVISETDGNGNIKKYEYNKAGDITKTIYADGSSIINEYDYKNNDITVTSPEGYKTKYDYNSGGNLLSVTDLTKNIVTEKYEYDNNMRIKYKTVNGNAKTEYMFDGEDRIKDLTIKEVNSGKQLYSEKFEYETGSAGEKVKRIIKGDGVNTNDITDIIIKDRNGYVIERTTNSTHTVTYENNYVGETIKKTDNNGARLVTEYTYDYAGNLIKERDNNGIETKWEYDMASRNISVTKPNGNKILYEYDSFNRVIKESTPFTQNDTSIKYYEYDKAGNLTLEGIKGSTALSGERNRYYKYNSMNRLIKTGVYELDKTETYTTYEYDKEGNVIKQITGNGKNVTTYEYDHRGQITKLTYPEGGQERYTYNYTNGTMTGKTDRNNITISYTYDTLGNIIKETGQKDGKNYIRKAEYGLTGAKISEENENISVKYKYGTNGQISSEEYNKAGAGYLLKYYYNARGNIEDTELYERNDSTKLDYVKNRKSCIRYTYDNRGRIIKVYELSEPSVSLSSGKYIALYEYDLNDNIKKVTYGNKVVSEYEYNKADMISKITNKVNNINKQSYSYSYDYAGNIKNEIMLYSGKEYNKSYEYDSLGRLKAETITNSVIGTKKYEYGYDKSGNRAKLKYSDSLKPENSFTSDYVYNKDNMLLKESKYYENKKETENTIYKYDGNGNEILSATGNNINDFSDIELKDTKYEERTYDIFNQLITLKNNDNTTEYTYQPNGLRHTKKIDGNITGFIWRGNQLISETNGNFEPVNVYAYGLSRIKNNTGIYYNYNAHGDVVSLSDMNGNITKNYIYDAFGMEINPDKNDTNPWRYCGEYYDKETSSIYLRARYYNPRTGRFMTEDPIRTGQNWYMYCDGNPVMFIDPSGKITEEEQKMYEDGEMAPMAYTYLMKLTYNWYLADTQEEKDMWHKKAEDFRATGYTDTGNKELNDAIKFMSRLPQASEELTEEQHYFRNKLNIQMSWDDFQKLQSRLPDNLKFKKLIWYKSLFHMIGQFSNIKYVSACGHFEIVYTGENYLVDEKFFSLNMGTYNYYGPDKTLLHEKFDVAPWIKWGNTSNGTWLACLNINERLTIKSQV